MKNPKIIHKITELIGNTPLFHLATSKHGSRLLLKLEMFNPTGSAKVRMARQMVEEAMHSGRLPAGGEIYESTSGNTGMGLAMIAAEKGLTFTAVVDHHACKDKIRVMQGLGAKVRYVAEPGDERLATADRDALAAKLAASRPHAIWTEQHNNPANAEGYRGLAEELREAIGSKIDVLVGAVGTGGSLCGTARHLQAYYPKLEVHGVEPVGSIIFGGPGGPYLQSGTGNPPEAEIGALVDYDLIDYGHKVSDAQAFMTARTVARVTGLMVGGSAGGVIWQALALLDQLPPGMTVVALVCDGGEKYLDTVYDDQWMAAHGLLDESVSASVLSYLSPDAQRKTA